MLPSGKMLLIFQTKNNEKSTYSIVVVLFLFKEKHWPLYLKIVRWLYGSLGWRNIILKNEKIKQTFSWDCLLVGQGRK